MNINKICIAFVLAGMLCIGCNDTELVDEFVSLNSDICLTIKGTDVFNYSENLCQTGSRPSILEFRVSNDTMNDYYVVTLDKMPEVGQETTGTLVYTTDDDIITKSGLHFKLVKADGGLLWLWNRKNSIGVVVRQL